MNTEISHDGTEVYINQLYMLADEYIEQQFDGDEKGLDKRFRDLILYISDRVKKPSHDDIEGLDRLFSAYMRLCTRFGRLPTLQMFSLLTGINNATFTDWSNREYRSSTAHSKTVQKWKDTCKNFVIDELSNSKLANPNLIFISKACHGLRETSPLPVESNETRRVLSAAELPRLSPPEKEDY